MSEEQESLANVIHLLEGLRERLDQIDLRLAAIESDVAATKDGTGRLETGMLEVKLDMVALKGKLDDA